MAHERTAQLSASPADVREPVTRLLLPRPSGDPGGHLRAGRGRRRLARDRPRPLSRRPRSCSSLVGVAIWTLTEYWLHRLLFHWEPKFRGGDRLHFIIHGVHHDHPNDAMRLVMPPAVSVPLAALFLGLYVLVFGTPHAFPAFAGFILGYLSYDYMHYHVHHHVPKTKLREEAAQAPHAPPLPGPPLRLRSFLAALGRDHGNAAAKPERRGRRDRRTGLLQLDHPAGRVPPLEDRDHVVGRRAGHPVAGGHRRRADVRKQDAARRVEQ